MLRSRVLGLRKRLFDPLAWWLSRRELRELLAATDADSIVDGTFSFGGRGHYQDMRPHQNPEEIKALASMVESRQPAAIVELGTQEGGTLFIWTRVSRRAERIISVDMPAGAQGAGYHPTRARLYQSFVCDRPDTRLALVRADSQLPSTRDRVIEEMAGRPLQFLFIDADHRYEGARRDYELYSPLVANGGLIAFHDIVPSRVHTDYGVDRLWREIREGREHHEFIAERTQDGRGIGVLVV